jgi:hypothetical protein
MRCKNCDYTLWNIKARECPECGSAFKPSDFTFTLNAVRYCCPHCQQDYYGTGPQGELVPRSFICVSCARPIDMDEMVLLPTEGVSEEITQPDVMPWLERRKIGFLRGFFGTIVRAMGSPGRLIKMVPEDHPPTHAFIFAALTNLLYIAVGLSPLLLIMLVPMLGVGGPGGMRGAAASAGGTAGFALSAWAVVMVLVVVWGAAAHLVLWATGTTTRGIGRTYHAVCYSSGANALVAIPCFGPYLCWVFCAWWIVSAIIMLKEAQGVSAGRAVAAILGLPMVIATLGVLTFVGFIVASSNGAFGPGSQQSWSVTAPPAPAASNDSTSPLGRANEVMISVLDARSSNLAFHPAELLRYPLGESLLPGTSELAGGLSGAEIDQLDTEPTEAIVEAVIEAQPAAALQRFGDFVFVHRGLPADQFGNSPLDAWVFILAPKAESLPDTIHVGVAGGGILSMTRADFLDQLDLENQRRAGWGIEPITAPNEVGQ